MEKFEDGDVVTLKSGGLKMTITGIINDHANCVYTAPMDGGFGFSAGPTIHERGFPLACLVKEAKSISKENK